MRLPPWTPNAITALRVALVPWWLVLAVGLRRSVLLGLHADRSSLVLVFAVIGLSDLLDGFLARRFGLATPWGAVLDAAADKFAQIAAVTFLALFGSPAFEPLPLWLMLTLASRDLLLGAGWAFLRLKAGIMEASHRWHGKLSSFVLFCLILAVSAGLKGPAVPLASALVVALVVPSTLAYVAAGRRRLRGR